MSVYQLAPYITAHAWNADRTMVAVCENDNLVVIYGNCQAKNVKDWEKVHILQAHTMVVCGIDWHPVTNQIVTCSHDINAFVWTYDTRMDSWKPSLSILRVNRACLQVRWSPDGTKFACGSGSKIVSICYFEPKNDWWISKIIKKHKSSVVDVAWHPNSQVVATASTDFKCRIFSAFLDHIEQPAQAAFGSMSKFPFGELITEFDSSNGWVEAVAWSPSGEYLAFAGHDSTVSFVSFPNGQPFCQLLRTRSLPYTNLVFLNDSVLVAAGYSFTPEIFQAENRVWSLLGQADKRGEDKQSKKNNKRTQFAAQAQMWENKIQRGQTTNDGAADLWTRHHNVITDIAIYGDARHEEHEAFSTVSYDGRLVIWDKATLQKNIPGIRV